jgi:DNA-directed RNA polymerase subunit L
MAKKKKVESEESLDDEIDDFEDADIESAYPEIDKKKPVKSEDEDVSEEDLEPIMEEDLEEFELEEKPEFPDYKYIDLVLSKGLSENDYELEVKGQTHGFCNIFVKHLLEIKGVKMAAYKYTAIEPAKIFIRIGPGSKIKEILHKGIENLRKEVQDVQKVFQKLM